MDDGSAGAGAGTVVVGVDESAGSRGALSHALREAGRRGLPVLAVMAYDLPEMWAVPMPAPIMDRDEIQDAMRGVIEAAVEEVVAELTATGEPVPLVRTLVRPGSPGVVLPDVARGAELLVVGHRGRSGLATRLIGSVGLSCVVHAPCTVTVVRPEQPPPEAASEAPPA